MNKLLIILAFVLLPITLLAQQEEPPVKLSNHAIGASASMISGPGISYQYVFGDQRIQLTGFALYSKNGSSGVDLTGIIGAEYQHDLQSTRDTRFYILGGAYYITERNSYSYYYSGDGTSSDNYTKQSTQALGVGLGFEVALWNHVMLNLDGGLMFSNETRHDYGYNSSYTNSSYPRQTLGPAAAIGLMYRF